MTDFCLDEPDMAPPGDWRGYVDGRTELLGRQLCRAAAGWLRSADALLLAFGLDDGKLALRCWDHLLAPRQVDGADACRLATDLVPRLEALDATLRQRWFDAILPDRIGLFCDGSGLGFTPADPWPMAPGWIERRIGNPAGIVALRRFDPAGCLAMITAPRARAHNMAG